MKLLRHFLVRATQLLVVERFIRISRQSRRTVAKSQPLSFKVLLGPALWLLIREFGSGKATATSLFLQMHRSGWFHNRRGFGLGVVFSHRLIDLRTLRTARLWR